MKMDISQVEKGLLKLAADVEARSRKVEKVAADEVLALAKERTPVDTGKLKASGRVAQNEGGTTIEFTADYALAVHERLDVYHSNGQAKFLESSIDELGAQALLRATQDEFGSL